jgi:hypothetical protein
MQRTLGNRGMGLLIEQASAGRPLDPATLADAEERFGHGFEQVRVHDDEAAHAAAASLGARAFTHGADVFLGAGEQPDGRLLDHELAHVVQQSRGGPRPPALDPGAPEERAAERAAEPGAEPVEVEGATSVGVARQASGSVRLSPAEREQLEQWLAAQQPDIPRLIREQERTEAEQRLAASGQLRDRLTMALGGRTARDAALAEPPPGIARLPARIRRIPTLEFVPTNIEKGGGKALVTGTTSIVQNRPDPTAGYQFDTYLLNQMTGALIPAQHLGGTRFRVLMGTSECPGCHFGQGLVVDLEGTHFGLIAGQMLMSLAGAFRRPEAPQAAGSQQAPAPTRLTQTTQQTPPPAPAARGQTTPVVVSQGGGTVTTSGGVSAAQPGGTTVVQMPQAAPVPQPAPLSESGAGVLQRPVPTPSGVTPGVNVGWTTDPNAVVKAVEAAGGVPVLPSQLGPAPLPPGPGIAPGTFPWLATFWRPGTEETPFKLPGVNEGPRWAPGKDPTPRLAPAAQPPIARYFPAPEDEPTDPRLFPGQSRAPMSERPDPLRDFLQLAGSAPNMSRRRDRRTGDLRELGVAEYREHTYADRRDDALEGHEIVQNAWLQVHRYTSERGTGMASRWNPTIALPPEVHRAVSAYQAALGLYDRKALKKMGYQEMLDLNELALREGLRDSGYSEATISRVVKRAAQEAWEHAIFTIAKGKRGK